jgi:hypothetical protein
LIALTHPTGAPVSAYGDARRHTRLRERLQTNGAAIAVAAVFALLCALFLFDDPGRAPTLTIDNPTAFDIRVEVSDAGRAEWTVLTSARQQCAASVEAPVDRGQTWVFRLRTQGLASEEIAVDRADLERVGWHFAIPVALAQQWEAAGVPHPPRQSC